MSVPVSPQTKTLRMFTDGTDCVIAYDEADATAAWEETIGDKRDPEFYDPWEVMPDEAEYTLDCTDADPVEGEWHPRRTVAFWIEQFGRGFFASTEY